MNPLYLSSWFAPFDSSVLITVFWDLLFLYLYSSSYFENMLYFYLYSPQYFEDCWFDWCQTWGSRESQFQRWNPEDFELLVLFVQIMINRLALCVFMIKSLWLNYDYLFVFLWLFLCAGEGWWWLQEPNLFRKCCNPNRDSIQLNLRKDSERKFFLEMREGGGRHFSDLWWQWWWWWWWCRRYGWCHLHDDDDDGGGGGDDEDAAHRIEGSP